MRKRFYGLFIVLLLCAFSILGCDMATNENNVGRKVQKATARAAAEAISQTGMPAIKNFAELKLAKWIYELRDNPKLVCYAYIKNEMTGDFKFIGKCLGYGLPYSVQMTNPQKLVKVSSYFDFAGIDKRVMTIPQPDPNMLYSPAGLSATFLVMMDAKGEPWPVYVESEITVSPFPLLYAVYPKGVDFFKKGK